jgi:hypothetical protein
VKAITFIDDFSTSLRETTSQLSSPVKLILKKEGFNNLRSSILDTDGDIIMAQREIVDVKRKTERILSQLLTLSVAFRSCKAAGSEKDLIYFARALLEKTPIHDRHFALLLLSRGILAPPYSKGGKSGSGDISKLGENRDFTKCLV